MMLAPDSCPLTANFWQDRMDLAHKMLLRGNLTQFEDEVSSFVYISPTSMPATALALAAAGLSILASARGELPEAKAYLQQASEAMSRISIEDQARFTCKQDELEDLCSRAESYIQDPTPAKAILDAHLARISSDWINKIIEKYQDREPSPPIHHEMTLTLEQRRQRQQDDIAFMEAFLDSDSEDAEHTSDAHVNNLLASATATFIESESIASEPKDQSGSTSHLETL